jgi:Domain of unknown function (DUF4397)
VKFRLISWRAALLLSLFTLLLGIPAAAVSSAATSNGWISVANWSETTSAVDGYVYSAGDASPQYVARDIGYGIESVAYPVAAGNYTVKMLPAGAAPSASPVLSASVTVAADHSYTVAALNVQGQGRQAKVLSDSLVAPAGKSLVRVVQASTNQSAVTFHCSCAKGAAGDIMSKGSTGTVSDYAGIPAGTWTMTATGSSAHYSMPVTLTPGTVHTELVYDTPGGIEIANLEDAAGSGQPPAGGVGTGFGGTAGHGPGSLLPWLAVISAGALLALGGGLRLRRNGAAPRDRVRPEPTRM